jgi:hypothetical protein
MLEGMMNLITILVLAADFQQQYFMKFDGCRIFASWIKIVW